MARIIGRAGSLGLRPPAVPPPIRQSVSEGRVPILFYVKSLNVVLTETASLRDQSKYKYFHSDSSKGCVCLQ